MEKETKATKYVDSEQDRTIKKKSEFILAFKNSGFNISVTCETIGIDRATYYRWLEDDAFKLAIEYQKEAILDFAESKLLHFMNKSEDERLQFNAVQFFLKTKGKIRDYSEKQEIQHTGDMSIQYISHIPEEDEKLEEEVEGKSLGQVYEDMNVALEGGQEEILLVEIDELMQRVVI